MAAKPSDEETNGNNFLSFGICLNLTMFIKQIYKCERVDEILAVWCHHYGGIRGLLILSPIVTI